VRDFGQSGLAAGALVDIAMPSSVATTTKSDLNRIMPSSRPQEAIFFIVKNVLLLLTLNGGQTQCFFPTLPSAGATIPSGRV
jgi:hypothetical protein